jgi:hypothetical protein
MQLQRLRMRGGDHWPPAQDARQHAVGVGAAHVGMDHLGAEPVDPSRDADQLLRRAPEAGFEQLDLIQARLPGDPCVGTVQQQDLVAPPAQVSGQQQRVNDGAVDAGTGDHHRDTKGVGRGGGHSGR